MLLFVYRKLRKRWSVPRRQKKLSWRQDIQIWEINPEGRICFANACRKGWVISYICLQNIHRSLELEAFAILPKCRYTLLTSRLLVFVMYVKLVETYFQYSLELKLSTWEADTCIFGDLFVYWKGKLISRNSSSIKQINCGMIFCFYHAGKSVQGQQAITNGFRL